MIILKSSTATSSTEASTSEGTTYWTLKTSATTHWHSYEGWQDRTSRIKVILVDFICFVSTARTSVYCTDAPLISSGNTKPIAASNTQLRMFTFRTLILFAYYYCKNTKPPHTINAIAKPKTALIESGSFASAAFNEVSFLCNPR